MIYRVLYAIYFIRSGPVAQSEIEQRYSFNPETEKAFIDPQGEYGVMLNRGFTPRSTEPFNPEQLNQVQSQNVLRYLADNPITGVNTISFKTQKPGDVYTYESKDLPRPVFDLMERFVKQEALRGLRPGTLVVNRPIPTEDIVRNLEESGLTPEESSTLRRRETFIGKEPNARAAAYRAGGFGPLTSSGEQMAYVNAEGNIVPLQARRADATLRGEILVNPVEAEIIQSRLPLTTRAYYAADPLSSAVRGAAEVIRRNPLGTAGGAALTLTNEDVAKAIEQNKYGQAATAAAKDIGTGIIAEQALKLAGEGLRRAAPQAASRIVPLTGAVANVAIPAAVGAGLFSQGQTGSATQRLVEKAADVLPGLRPNPRTDLGRRASNEARYVVDALLRGKLPYLQR